MRKFVLAGVATLMVAAAGCTTAEQTAVGGAVAGGAIGGLATGNATGVAVGALAGGAGGYIVGRAIDNRPGYCQDVDQRTGRAVGSPYRC